MAVLNIREYGNIAVDNANRLIQVGIEPAITGQSVTGTTTSTQSSAFNAKTKFIRVWSTTDALIEIGSNPTAAAGSMTISAGHAEYIGVTPGHKIAVKNQ
jgi:hypothetical protein